MCGLVGIFVYKQNGACVQEKELLIIRDHMSTRGPDSSGLWINNRRTLGLAHRRLSIIDLSVTATQPIASQDGRYHIVFNGEIYNYEELRSNLEKIGVTFNSTSDTEVLLKMYIVHGSDACKYLRGMFAFAIWDNLEEKLFLARDSFGIKPLYISNDGETLRFASQVKALLAGGAVSKSIDPLAERDYWVWGHIPEPRTLFSAIRPVPPGSWLEMAVGGRVSQGQFNSAMSLLSGELQPASFYPNLQSALEDTVEKHLIADVPVGIFLSGGVDSAVIASVALKFKTKIQTITLGFEDLRGTLYDEVASAESTAKYLGAEHTTVWISSQNFIDTYPQFIHSMDQPTTDGMNTWLISKATQQAGLKVALSGVGSDEFLGGYPSFKLMPKMRFILGQLSKIKGLGYVTRKALEPFTLGNRRTKLASLFEYGDSWGGIYMLMRGIRMPWEQSDEEYNYNLEIPTNLDSWRTVSYLESSRYMRDQLLRDTDWASLGNSIEVRVPFVDKEFVSFLFHDRNRVRNYTKQDMKSIFPSDHLARLLDRPKLGFSIPRESWIKKLTLRDIKSEDLNGAIRNWQAQIFRDYMESIS